MNVAMPTRPAVVPFSLRDAPSFIEAQFPVGRVSTESYKERTAVQGQLLTTLGSYWKGRKPLVLARATLLGCLLPTTDNPVGDLRVFLLLMGMHDDSFASRVKSLSAGKVSPEWPDYLKLIEPGPRPAWRRTLTKQQRIELIVRWLLWLPYDRRVELTLRPEEVDGEAYLDGIWDTVNFHLGTTAGSLPELVRQLGIMRFGAVPRVADTFSGSGSIPFESARIGCDVFASDVNPVACALTWGAFNLVGATAGLRAEIAAGQRHVVAEVEREIIRSGVEVDSQGNRAKSFLYCLEATCPRTGWQVPLLATLVVSKGRSAIAKLVPDTRNKRYDILVESGVSPEEMAAAELGTLRDGRVVHPANPEKDGVSLQVVRGDHRGPDRSLRNNIRRWENMDVVPRSGDVFTERLYCIQWITKKTADKARQETFFAAVRPEDLDRERRVLDLVVASLPDWQQDGLVPAMAIAPGEKTDEPIRTRGWTYWHHFFHPRHLHIFAMVRRAADGLAGVPQGAAMLGLLKALDWGNRGCRFGTGAARESISNLFSNQALNTLYNYGVRSSWGLLDHILLDFGPAQELAIMGAVRNEPAVELASSSDIFITDPPYADAVNYQEITEFFIAWMTTRSPAALGEFRWRSSRDLAIQGADEKFRSDMVAAYRNMAAHMPDNGMQVVMFTHQDAGVWADLAAIMWAAGLRVTAAWNIVTETESALKQGNYVQGTILLVLRKRLAADNVKRMDIEGEIEEAVDHQLAALHDLDEDWTSERLYTDGDLQLAAYAAALRVITGYATIDRKDVGADVYRKLAKGEKTVIRELIEYAASVANNKLVPDGFPPPMWRDLGAPSRFYVRMLDMEHKGTTKFADYQDFARTFSVADYADLMDSTKANAASLAGSGALKARMLGGKGFGSSPLRRVLFATHKTMQKDDPREGLAFLRTELGQDYWVNRAKLVAFAKYVSAKTARTRPAESSAADLLAQRLEVDKV